MKSLTLAVIFAGFMTYWYAVLPSTEDPLPAYSAIATHNPPIAPDPDDDEDDTRVVPTRPKKGVSN